MASMEKLPGQQETIRLVVTDDPKPKITLGGLDLTGHVSEIQTKMNGIDATAWIEVHADIEMDAGMTGATIVRASDPPTVTPDEIEQILIQKGASERSGEVIVQHLIDRGIIVADSGGAPDRPTGG